MTPGQIAAARALVDAATKGPWTVMPAAQEVWHCGYDRRMVPINFARIPQISANVLPDGVEKSECQISGIANARFVAWCRDGVPALLDALAAAEARAADLTAKLKWAHDNLWEINPNNYDHDDVCKLNDASVNVILEIAPMIGETHGQIPEWWAVRAALKAGGA